MSKAKSTYEILYLHYTHIVHYYAQSILTSFYLKQKHYAAFIRRVSRGRARLVRRIGLFFFSFQEHQTVVGRTYYMDIY